MRAAVINCGSFFAFLGASDALYPDIREGRRVKRVTIVTIGTIVSLLACLDRDLHRGCLSLDIAATAENRR